MHTGWFPVDRELLTSDLWLAEKFTRAQAWIDLLGLARFKPGFVRLRGKRVDLKRGQVAWSQRELARRWGWSIKKVRGFLQELESDQLATYQNVGVTTVVTLLCNDPVLQDAAPTTSPITAPSASPTTAPSAQSLPTKEQGQQGQHRQPPLEGWGDLEVALKKLGVSAARSAIESACSQSFDPNDVRQWIEEFQNKPGAWGAGALVARITGKLSEWPPPCEDYLRQQRRQQAAADQRRQASSRAARRAEFARQQQAEQDRERQFGPVLDAMDETQRTDLERQAIPDSGERALSRNLPTVHRARLLLALESQAKASGAKIQGCKSSMSTPAR